MTEKCAKCDHLVIVYDYSELEAEPDISYKCTEQNGKTVELNDWCKEYDCSEAGRDDFDH